VPEKDGLLAGLLAAELVAVYGAGLTELLNHVAGEFGRVCSRRLDVRTSYAEKERVLGLLKGFDPETLAGRKVTGRNTLDGVKLLLEGGAWVLIRPSGTEPLFRIYVEAATLEDVQKIQKEAAKTLGLQPGAVKT
jgi:phosphomannomutase